MKQIIRNALEVKFKKEIGMDHELLERLNRYYRSFEVIKNAYMEYDDWFSETQPTSGLGIYYDIAIYNGYFSTIINVNNLHINCINIIDIDPSFLFYLIISKLDPIRTLTPAWWKIKEDCIKYLRSLQWLAIPSFPGEELYFELKDLSDLNFVVNIGLSVKGYNVSPCYTSVPITPQDILREHILQHAIIYYKNSKQHSKDYVDHDDYPSYYEPTIRLLLGKHYQINHINHLEQYLDIYKEDTQKNINEKYEDRRKARNVVIKNLPTVLENIKSYKALGVANTTFSGILDCSNSLIGKLLNIPK